MGGRKKTETERPRVQVNQRRSLGAPLIVMQTRSDSAGWSFFGYAKNISRGGMFIASINPPTPGCRFRLQFPLPGRDAERVSCECEVVWSRSYSRRGPYEPGMGLRFLDLPEPEAGAIDAWVRTDQEA